MGSMAWIMAKEDKCQVQEDGDMKDPESGDMSNPLRLTRGTKDHPKL